MNRPFDVVIGDPPGPVMAAPLVVLYQLSRNPFQRFSREMARSCRLAICWAVACDMRWRFSAATVLHSYIAMSVGEVYAPCAGAPWKPMLSIGRPVVGLTPAEKNFQVLAAIWHSARRWGLLSGAPAYIGRNCVDWPAAVMECSGEHSASRAWRDA
ncbi:MAG: hypothetical protein ACYDH5_05155 [Acidimicrobiales bacterium]